MSEENAKYQVYKDMAGEFRFRLRAPNNEIVAVGESYESKEGCMNGVMAVKKNCGAKVQDLTGQTTNLCADLLDIGLGGLFDDMDFSDILHQGSGPMNGLN